MDLWIRSQAKMSLVKVYAVTVLENDNIYTIIGYTNHDSQFWLADYDTKERELEILDEIQENIVKQGQVIILTDERGFPNGNKFFSYVYEMPSK